MDKKILKLGVLAFIGLGTLSYAQEGNVGVNTTTPAVTLDVTGRPTDTTKRDGIMAPRLTGNQLFAKNAIYTATHAGALVYVTEAASSSNQTGKTVNVDDKGYYYFDGNVWVKATGISHNIYTADGSLTSARTATLRGYDLTFDAAGMGKVIMKRNGGNLVLAGSGDNQSHAYMEIFRNGVDNARTAYIGHEGEGDNNLTLRNEISNGRISLKNNTRIGGDLTIDQIPAGGNDDMLLVSRNNVVSSAGFTLGDLRRSQVDYRDLSSVTNITLPARTESRNDAATGILHKTGFEVTVNPGEKNLYNITLGVTNMEPALELGTIFLRVRFLEESESNNGAETLTGRDGGGTAWVYKLTANENRLGAVYAALGMTYNQSHGVLTGSLGLQNTGSTPKKFFLYADTFSSGTGGTGAGGNGAATPPIRLNFSWAETSITQTPVR